MTAEEVQLMYQVATGIRITKKAAKALIRYEKNPMFKKVIHMALPSIWGNLNGTYNEVK